MKKTLLKPIKPLIGKPKCACGVKALGMEKQEYQRIHELLRDPEKETFNFNEPPPKVVKCSSSYGDFSLRKSRRSDYAILSILDDVKGLMRDRLDALQDLITDMNETKEDLETMTNNVKFVQHALNAYQEKLDTFKEKVLIVEAKNFQLCQMRLDIKQIEDIIDERDKWSRATVVEIKGVPYDQDENLYEILLKIAGLANMFIPREQITFLKRDVTRGGRRGHEKAIVVCFVSSAIKEGFLKGVQAVRNLNAKALGYDVNKDVFAV
ncbi:unnamed protein product [Plutella xylostella]|uniref:(diamondback moth) hypothetical protein n=1 Tax=Plutella xylostella TaxID=51655 RepID=A0A8S4FSL3_PLUXY|nr:unnamed protein product [Plutella xylostella]